MIVDVSVEGSQPYSFCHTPFLKIVLNVLMVELEFNLQNVTNRISYSWVMDFQHPHAQKSQIFQEVAHYTYNTMSTKISSISKSGSRIDQTFCWDEKKKWIDLATLETIFVINFNICSCVGVRYIMHERSVSGFLIENIFSVSAIIASNFHCQPDSILNSTILCSLNDKLCSF